MADSNLDMVNPVTFIACPLGCYSSPDYWNTFAFNTMVHNEYDHMGIACIKVYPTTISFLEYPIQHIM
jgi:hypothetical protein